MSENIIKLVTDNTRPPVEVNEELVKMFEQMLAWAKEGAIISGAVAIAYPDGATGNCFNTREPILLLGEMRAMEREILDICIDGRMHEAGTEY